ncbi:sugar efflux transporter [Dactylosporangium sp. AC04546]|uniref:sugar efflux transporter n=1 Tax=Dactylosporangium sp. AC04546 TaxID=2862460 RepID=UPI001EDDB7F9|nr:sugar efflux transporter [Dactylosporangium sp. AC04546]WVK88022.1 sugar efflux transporter [Dactylosporangium sp. AC04546]
MLTATKIEQRPLSLVPLGVMFFFVGLSAAVVGPFLSLFLSTAVHAGPAFVAAFLIIGPVSSVVSSTVIGRLSDKRAIRRRLLLIAAAAGCTGSVVTAFVRDYWVLVAVAVTLTAVSGSLFPQSFAYAREVLQQNGSTRAAMAISTLRMLFSIAWVAGPPVAAVLLEVGSFRMLYLTAAAMYVLAGAVALVWLKETGPPPGHPDAERPAPLPSASRFTVLRVVAALTVLQSAGVLGVQAMSLFVGHVLHADVSNAGLILGWCAALEIPLMLAFGALSAKWALRNLMAVGAVLGAVYYALVTGSSSTWQVMALQLLNACFIAAVGGLGISYVQELLPSQPGRAATLAGNVFPVGSILAGPLLGVAQHLGYRWAYGFGAALCAAGLILLLTTRSPRTASA